MITTVCLNPTFDKTVEVDELRPGEVNRIASSRTDVGGKGVNVAVVLRRLGLDTQVIGLAGMDGVDKLRAAMDTEGVGHRFVPVAGAVRVNTKVVSTRHSVVTELNESGPMTPPEALAELFALARHEAGRSEYLVITGSLPPGCPSGTYRELIRAVGDTPCILDVGGTELILGTDAKPFLVKPNHHELAATLHMEIRSVEDVKKGAKALLNSGVRHVVASMGAEGALYMGDDGCYYAPQIPVQVHSTVGAGDAMVGGILYGLSRFGSMKDAFRCGVAAGTASVMTKGTQLIVPEQFCQLLDQVQIRTL